MKNRDRECSRQDCSRTVHGRGLCGTHHKQAYLAGELPPRLRDTARHPEGAVQVPRFPYYSVTGTGVVWSISSGTAEPLALRPNQAGYPCAHLFNGSRSRLVTVHQLVARAFLGDPEAGQEVRHLDGDPTNCDVSNLAWGTPVENAADRERHGTTARGTRHGSARFTPDQVRDVRTRHAAGASQYSLAKEYGVSKTAIWKIVNERVWTGASLES